MTDRAWLDLTSALAAGPDAELRTEAADLLAAEGARCRLVDRAGPATVRLDDGSTVDGELVPDVVDGWLALDVDGRRQLVPVAAVVWIDGSRTALRREDGHRPATIGSWLREADGSDSHVRADLLDGRVVRGRVVFVGADHAEIAAPTGSLVVPFAAVRRWEQID